jgi:hypothetical protein
MKSKNKELDDTICITVIIIIRKYIEFQNVF